MSKPTGNNKKDNLAKITMIGEGTVGKTSILMRFTEGTFQANMIPTLGIDFKLKKVSLQNGGLKLQIWDTAGQERFRAITENFFKGSLGIILVFDLCNLSSLQRLDTWMTRINSQQCDDAILIVIGNKSDQANGEVSRNQIDEFVAKYGLKYYETSAKLNKGIDLAFQELSDSIAARFYPEVFGIPPSIKPQQLNNNNNPNNGTSSKEAREIEDSIISPPDRENQKKNPQPKQNQRGDSIILSSIQSQTPNNHKGKGCCS